MIRKWEALSQGNGAATQGKVQIHAFHQSPQVRMIFLEMDTSKLILIGQGLGLDDI